MPKPEKKTAKPSKPSDRAGRPRKEKPCPICSRGIEYIDYKYLALLKPLLYDRA